MTKSASSKARQRLRNEHPEIASSVRWLWRVIGQDLKKKDPKSYAEGKALTALCTLYPKEYKRLRDSLICNGYQPTHGHGIRRRRRLWF